jgi:hypothetical protein
MVATNKVVGHATTDAEGQATINVTFGVTYKLVETFAPPSLDAYVPIPGGGFTFTAGQFDHYDFNKRAQAVSCASVPAEP